MIGHPGLRVRGQKETLGVGEKHPLRRSPLPNSAQLLSRPTAPHPPPCAGGTDPGGVPAAGRGLEEGDEADAEGDGPRPEAGDPQGGQCEDAAHLRALHPRGLRYCGPGQGWDGTHRGASRPSTTGSCPLAPAGRSALGPSQQP